jgi:ATP-dependent DNA helicase RecG
MLDAMDEQPISAQKLMKRLRLRHQPSFMQAYVNPALAARQIDMTKPGAPRSSKQQYRLTGRGGALRHIKRRKS